MAVGPVLTIFAIRKSFGRHGCFSPAFANLCNSAILAISCQEFRSSPTISNRDTLKKGVRTCPFAPASLQYLESPRSAGHWRNW
jgi:hypothetical protein